MANVKPSWHKKANPNTKFVAGNAKTGRPNRKKWAKLQRRVKDYMSMSKTQGFRCPGSLQ